MRTTMQREGQVLAPSQEGAFGPTLAQLDGWHGEMGAPQAVLIREPWAGPMDWSDTPSGDHWGFCIGWGRSGTSVLTLMLNEHPDLYYGNEDNTLFNIAGLLSSGRVFTLQSSLLSYSNTAERQMSGAKLRRILQGWAEAYGPGATFYGDKAWEYFLHRSFFRKLFPGCKFIFTVRNPLDQLASNLRAGWKITYNGEGLDAAKQAWASVSQLINAYKQVKDESDVLIVPFELFDHLGDIVDTMRNVFGWLGANEAAIPDEVAFARYANDTTARKAEMAARARLEEPDRGGAIGRWKTEPRMQALLTTLRSAGIVQQAYLDQFDVPGTEYLEVLDVPTG